MWKDPFFSVLAMEKSFDTSHFLKSVFFSYLHKLSLLLLGFLYVFFLANHLGPEQFGVFSYLMDLAGAILFLLGTETFSELLRVFIPKTNARSLVRKVILFQIGIALLLAAVFFLFSDWITAWIGRGDATLVRWLAVVFVFIPISPIVYAIVSGNRQFGKLLILTVIEHLTTLVLTVLLVYSFGFGLLGAFWARIISLGILAVSSFWMLRTSVWDENQDRDTGHMIRSYSFQSFITGILKRIIPQAHLFFVGLFVSIEAMGFFYLLQKITSYFIEIPVNAVNEVLLPFANLEKNPERMEQLFSKSIKFYILFSFVAAGALLVLAQPILHYLFPAFEDALFLLPLFLVYYLFSFDYPLSTFFRTINKPQVITTGYFFSSVASLTVSFFLIAQLKVEGLLLAMIFIRILNTGVLLHALRKEGYSVEMVPRVSDLKFFGNLIRALVDKEKTRWLGRSKTI